MEENEVHFLPVFPISLMFHNKVSILMSLYLGGKDRNKLFTVYVSDMKQLQKRLLLFRSRIQETKGAVGQIINF